MEILEQTQGAVRVLKPRGPLAAPDADDFKTRATVTATESLGRVLIDASAIPFADSRGLEVLAELSDELGQSGRSLKLCCATDTLREVLELTELAGLFEFYDDVNDAVRSFL
jgi:anti-sigma B factor antagonist